MPPLPPETFAELSGLMDQVRVGFSDFKAKNDSRLGELERRFKGLGDLKASADARLAEVERNLRELETTQARLELGAGARSLPDRDGLSAKAREALTVFGRTGNPQLLQELNPQAALQVGEDPKGGYTVPPDVSSEINKVARNVSPMRELAFVQNVTKPEWQEIVDKDDTEAKWVSETGARDGTDNPELALLKIPNHEVYAAPMATQAILDDADWDIALWLTTKIGEAFGEKEAAAFVTGNGVGKPRGFLTYPTAATADATRPWGTTQHIATGAAGNFAGSNPADCLVDTVHALKAAYRNDAAWQMNSKTFGAVRKLKDGQGNYLVEPDMRDGLSYRLLGYPVVENEDMPDIAANSLSIAFGNWRRGYVITDRNISLLRDPYSKKPYVMFYAVKRVGGDCRNSHALKLVKFAAA
jgi:HK97 family phage major capsid protein